MDIIVGMRTFVTVVEAGSFTAAAARLDMSTALVSKYIGQLEQRLGSRLLNRTTRSLALTEIGKAYFERCRQVIDDFDELEAAVQNKRSIASGKLIVTAPVTFGEMYLTSAIAEFLEQQPAITIDLRLTDRFVSLVDEGVDIAIRIAELEDSALIARRIAPARIIICATPSYIEQHGAPDKPDDLEHHSCIIDTNFRNGALWPFVENAKQTAIKVNGRFSVNSATAVREMLLKGSGLGLIPTYAVGDDIAQGRLVPVLEEFEATNLGIYAIYAHNRYLAAKVRVFIDFMANRFGTSPQWDRF